MKKVDIGDPKRCENQSDGASQSDGAFCHFVQRPISRLISRRTYPYLSANKVTAIGLLVGILSAGSFLLGLLVPGVVLAQLFGVLSCVDGQTARLRRESSKLGDYFDTMVDRVVEVSITLALTYYLASQIDPTTAYRVGMWYLAGVFVITTSSEKFRSVYKLNYPKRQLERGFCWVSAGSDIRLLVLCIGCLLLLASRNVWILVIILVGLTITVFCNVLFRICVIAIKSAQEWK